MFDVDLVDPAHILANPICDAITWATSDTCDCRLPCTEKKYDIKVTQVAWPSLASHLQFYENYIQNRPDIYGDKFDIYQQILDSMDNMTTSAGIGEIGRFEPDWEQLPTGERSFG